MSDLFSEAPALEKPKTPALGTGLPEVDLECPECAKVFTGTFQSAGKERKAHRIAEHGYVPPEAKPKRQKSPAVERVTAVTPPSAPAESSTPRKTAASPKAPAKRTKVPTRDEWEKKLTLTLGIASTAHVARVVDRSRLPREEHEIEVDRLALDDDECGALALPFSGVVADGPLSGLNKKFGRQALDLLDLLPAAIALVSYQARVANFQREYGTPRTRRIRQFQGQQQGAPSNGNRPVEGAPAPSFESIDFAVYGPGAE